MLFARRAALQGQLHLTIPVTDEGSLLETAYPVASVTVSGYAERYADALMFFPIIGIITGYLGDFVKSFPWIIAFSLGTSLIYAVTVGMGERIHGSGQRRNPYSDIRQRLERSHRICQRGDPCRSEGRSRGSQVGRDSPDFSLAVGFPHGDYRRFLCLRLRKIHIFDVL